MSLGFDYCGFHAIRTLSPPTSGHPFLAHPDRQSKRSDAGLHCLSEVLGAVNFVARLRIDSPLSSMR